MRHVISDQASQLTIRGWRKCCYRIFPAAPTRKAFRGPTNGLEKFICERCSQFLPVNTELAQLKARELPREARVPRNNSCSGYKSSCIVRDSRFAEGRRSPRSFWPSTKKNWPSFSATSFGQPPFDCGFHLHYFALYYPLVLHSRSCYLRANTDGTAPSDPMVMLAAVNGFCLYLTWQHIALLRLMHITICTSSCLTIHAPCRIAHS